MKNKTLRKALALVCAAAVSGAVIGTPASAADDSLVGYWPLGDWRTSSSFVLSSGATYTTSCEDNWGATKNTGNKSSWSWNGILGEAYCPGEQNDLYNQLTTEKVPTVKLDENGQMTVSMWIKTPADVKTAANGWVWGMSNDVPNDSTQPTRSYSLKCDKDGIVWHLRLAMDNEQLKTGGTVTGKKITVVDSTSITPDTWYHVGLKMVFNHGNGAYFGAEGYLNGKLLSGSSNHITIGNAKNSDNTYDCQSFFPAQTNGKWTMTIGAGQFFSSSDNGSFDGLIDDVRIYNIAGKAGNSDQIGTDEQGNPKYGWWLSFKDGVDMSKLYSEPADSALVGRWTLDDGAKTGNGAEWESTGAGDWGKTTLDTMFSDMTAASLRAVGRKGDAFGPTNGSYLVTEKVPMTELDANNEMLISLWVKSPATLRNDETWVFGIGPKNGSGKARWNLRCDSKEGLAWEIPTGGTGAGVSALSNGNVVLVSKDELEADTWYHVALAIKRDVNKREGLASAAGLAEVDITAYVNGAKVESASSAKNWNHYFGIGTFFDSNLTYQCVIGGAARGTVGGIADIFEVSDYSGIIDDVRVYNNIDAIDPASIYADKDTVDARCTYTLDKTGENITGVTVRNTRSAAEGGKVYVAKFNSDNILTDTRSADLTARSDFYISATFDALSAADDETVKVFLWTDELVPAVFDAAE